MIGWICVLAALPAMMDDEVLVVRPSFLTSGFVLTWTGHGLEDLAHVSDKAFDRISRPKLLESLVRLTSCDDALNYLRLFSNSRTSQMGLLGGFVEVRSREDVTLDWFLGDRLWHKAAMASGDGAYGICSRLKLDRLGYKEPIVLVDADGVYHVTRLVLKHSKGRNGKVALFWITESVTHDGKCRVEQETRIRSASASTANVKWSFGPGV